ncbi:MAG: hypothetical protein VX038_05030 [Verrucomicrobiota bacterium]|nr:hypothetical protein [Verrucomicrobiota bacterium]
MNKPQKVLLPWFFILFLLSGCSYKAGFTDKTRECSLSLHFKNNSKAIQFTPIVKRIVKDEFFKIPEIKVFGSNTRNRTDYVVKITLSDYRLTPESFQSDDSIVAKSFRARIVAQMLVIKQSDGEKILERDFSFTASSSHTSRLEHLRDSQLQVSLARDMGQKMVRDIIQSIHKS